MLFFFAAYTIDSTRREIRQGDDVIHVEPQVFDLLLYLIENRDRVVGKNELFDAVWPGRTVSEATLSSRISAARRAIGDTGEKQAFIRTVPRRGFLFRGDQLEARNAAFAGSTTHARPQAMGAQGKQKVTFCRTPSGLNLAVASVGDGPPLVKTANWLTHLDYDWQSPFRQTPVRIPFARPQARSLRCARHRHLRPGGPGHIVRCVRLGSRNRGRCAGS